MPPGDARLRHRRIAAALVLAASLPTWSFAGTGPTTTVDGKPIPDALFDAFVRNREHRGDVCRDLSPERHRADFVRMLLQAREVGQDARLEYEEALRPVAKRHRRLTALIDTWPEGHHVRTVYERARARTLSRMDALREDLDRTIARKSRLDDRNGLLLLDGTSAGVRAALARNLGLQRTYRQAIRDSVTDADILRRHGELIDAGDPRLVDVHLFKFFTIYASDTSAARVARIRELFDRNASIEELRNAGDAFTPGSYATPRWERFDSGTLPDVDPAALRPGDVIVSHLDGLRAPFAHVLVVDRQHLDRLMPEGPTLANRSPLSIARSEEMRDRFRDDYRALLRRHVVTVDGVPFADPALPVGCH